MQSLRFIYWQEDDAWLGYPEDFRNYWAKGSSVEDLKEHLKDLYEEFQSGQIPGV
jgi:predicted RNase H-like HicB family nuclease